MEMLCRYMKLIDKNNRITIPKIILDKVKTKQFYLEYYDDGTIKLVPIKNKK